MSNTAQQARLLGQSIWYDNICRDLLTSGEMKRLIELGVGGVTSNPTIFEKAICGTTDYDEALLALMQAGHSTPLATFEALAIEDIRATADLLRSRYDETNGADGYVSLEVSPAIAYNTEATISEGIRLFSTLNRPNVMIKVPATSDGIIAVRRLIAQGINVNVTLIFSVETYHHVMGAYIAGLEDLERSGGDLAKVASVASFFVSRIDTVVDALLRKRIHEQGHKLSDLLGKAAIANAKLAYHDFKETFAGERFTKLQPKGARVQRPLWASTGTKDPLYSDVVYMNSLIGRNTVNTAPPATLEAFLEHGLVEPTLEQNVEDARQIMDSLEDAGVSMKQVTSKLLVDGVKAFADSFDRLLANIDEKKTRLWAEGYIYENLSLGKYLPKVEAMLADLNNQDVVGRIWQKDHTVWKPDPTEITNRLGWLKVIDLMSEQLQNLKTFAQEVWEDGYRHMVLLGMGGSCLGPEVLCKIIQPSLNGLDSSPGAGKLKLTVLDSTVPACVQEVTEAVDPTNTIFLVSSKSGDTVESNSFYRHFRDLMDKSVGREMAGQSFVAITDAGTPLERLAKKHGFRRVFLNPVDVGGRYSVLSYFGLVPATLAGINVAELLDRANQMREVCDESRPADHNPGALLGAVMGALALEGRDKLTLVTSPCLSSFGLWVEQLISESTGKEGKGIIPIAGEPLLEPNYYGDDRLFVHLRLEGDDNDDIDASLESIRASGQPLVRLELRDRYNLGAELFRWQFATAIAGNVLGIHPFDQRDVQGAKDMTAKVLSQFQLSGRLPMVETSVSLRDLLNQVRPGNYLSIMAYLHQTPEVDQAMAELRQGVMERCHIATTLGYGPRFLHSTGQLHKGGPATGLFIQVTTDGGKEIPVPGKPYTFDILANAQALGDLQVLSDLGLPVAKVHLSSTNSAALRGLAHELA